MCGKSEHFSIWFRPGKLTWNTIPVQRFIYGAVTCVVVCWLFTPVHEIWNETDWDVKVLIISFNLRVFASTEQKRKCRIVAPKLSCLIQYLVLPGLYCSCHLLLVLEAFCLQSVFSSKTHDQLDWSEVTDLINQQRSLVNTLLLLCLYV